MDAIRLDHPQHPGIPNPPEEPRNLTIGHGIPASWADRPIDPADQLLRRRVLTLSGEITTDTANDLNARLLYLDSIDAGTPITLRINSPGGEVLPGLGILDTMTGLESPVTTLCVGMAASMASVLLACGAHGHRAATPNSRVLIHQPWAPQFRGVAADLERAAAESLRLRARVDDILATATGHTAEKIRHDTDRDTWFSAEEAVAYGLIDQVRGTTAPPARADGNGHTPRASSR